ncbi:MAG: glycosyltransferase family 4 protein [Patescibacteria group bacterium]
MNKKILFITQKVDKNDDILGVYHEWIKNLASKVEQVSVICLYRGYVELPANVQVYSLGKEQASSVIKAISRLLYVIRFYKYIWRLRGDYDTVFVHMNSEYVLLGGFLWKLWHKKIIFWYNHPIGTWKARAAISFSRFVLHTSPYAFAARYKKAKQMPVGIDTEFFRRRPEIPKKKRSILYIGRISPIKNIDILIDALRFLDQKGIDFMLTIAGEPSKSSEYQYAKKIKEQAAPLVGRGKIKFIGSVPNQKTPELYNEHEICVNLTPTGSFDKMIIEAMSCETPVLVSNRTLADIFDADLQSRLIFQEKNATDLAMKLGALLRSSASTELTEIGARMRQLVVGKHDLKKMIAELILII